jgi:hypothetical protein
VAGSVTRMGGLSQARCTLCLRDGWRRANVGEELAQKVCQAFDGRSRSNIEEPSLWDHRHGQV